MFETRAHTNSLQIFLRTLACAPVITTRCPRELTSTRAAATTCRPVRRRPPSVSSAARARPALPRLLVSSIVARESLSREPGELCRGLENRHRGCAPPASSRSCADAATVRWRHRQLWVCHRHEDDEDDDVMFYL
jgi:hypothetical protein